MKIRKSSEIEVMMGRSAKDRKRHFEYNTVAGITLFTKAAIEGGVRPDDTHDLSDTMLQELEQTKTIAGIHDIFELAVLYLQKQFTILGWRNVLI